MNSSENDSENDSDSESNLTWYESDDDIDVDEIIYNPEEPGVNKFTIVLCQKYDKNIHGPAPKKMNTHYLTHMRFKKLHMNLINTLNHSNLRLEIAECIYLPSEHCVSILKTFWLKIIQKKWKQIIKERNQCITKRCSLNAIKYREIYGKWPADCSKLPQLKGMLSTLSRTISRTASI